MASIPPIVPVSYLVPQSASSLTLSAGNSDIPEKDTAKGDEQADNDGRRRGACHRLGLLEHETHGGERFLSNEKDCTVIAKSIEEID